MCKKAGGLVLPEALSIKSRWRGLKVGRETERDVFTNLGRGSRRESSLFPFRT